MEEDVLVLDVNLRARRHLDGHELLLDRLQNGATLQDGDRLQLLVTTAHDAHLHVAFCSTASAGSQLGALSIFPPQGSIRARRQQTTFVPGPQKEIVLDDTPGEEVLYLIVSRAELSHADASIASAIESARGGDPSTDCKKLHRVALQEAPSQRAAERPTRARKKRSKENQERLEARATPHEGPAYAGAASPRASRVRGAYVADRISEGGPVRADAAGIVVLRYELKHQSRR